MFGEYFYRTSFSVVADDGHYTNTTYQIDKLVTQDLRQRLERHLNREPNA